MKMARRDRHHDRVIPDWAGGLGPPTSKTAGPPRSAPHHPRRPKALDCKLMRGTCSSRLTASTLFPRNDRSTTSIFAFALHRSGNSAGSGSLTTVIAPHSLDPQEIVQMPVQGNRGLYNSSQVPFLSNPLNWS
jgi:hypothetical protein